MAARTQCLSCFGMALIAVLLAGCCLPANEFAPNSPCLFQEQVTTEALIAHVNQNIATIQTWRTFNAVISSPDLPFSVDASVAVEAPRNFRMVVRSPMGPEADIGSNQEHYWFWNRQDKSNRIYLANHEFESAENSGGEMPFQPEWIMESMGVIALDPAKLQEYSRDANARTLTLSEDRTSPRGEPVRKLTVIDLCHGLVREHLLVARSGRMIARAQLLDHYRDQLTQAVLPGKMHLEWPEAKMNMTITLKGVDVNSNITRSTFQVPNYKGSEIFQVGGVPADLARESAERHVHPH